MEKFNIKFLIYLPIILFFLPAFTIWIAPLKAGYLFFFVFLYIAIGLLFVTNYKYCINKIIKVYKNTPLKYFVCMLGLIILNSLMLSLLGRASILSSIRSIVMQIFLFIIPIMVYFICIIGKYISFKKFMKFFILLFWIMLVLGLVAYIGQLFNIEFINNIFDFFANARIIRFKMLGRTGFGSNYSAFGLPRLDNLFEEPSFYARFLFLFLPFVYSFGLTKVKIYSNNFLNFIIKKTLIPFTWISIILTLSPMFLILSILITLIYFIHKIFNIIRKYYLQIIMLISMIIIVITKIDLSETYLSRIINVLSNLNSLEKFILIEPSLATRICTYINTFYLFLKNPVFGIGLGAIQLEILNQIINSPIPVTTEMLNKANFAVMTNTRYSYNSNFIVDFLATNGIFISCLFAYFYYKLLKLMKIIIKRQKDDLSLYTVTVNAFYYMLIALFIKSFYDSCFTDLDMYFIFAIVILLIYFYKRNSSND